MFRSALGLDPDQSPFPWQEELLSRLSDCAGNRLALDVPTGLGKTSVIAAWLVALASKADLPRRLVYVVDRRAVVDQATEEATRLRKWLESQPDVKQRLGLGEKERLPISTLRGQFADNREWLSDPTLPTIVVGTVDMVGSRLLFEGYGVSRKMRPYHAGFLGIDTLFVLDEAHLVPPFEALLQSVVETDSPLHGDKLASPVVPRSMLLTLSATGRATSDAVLQIDNRDLQHSVAGQRLNAVKRLTFHEPKKDESLDLAARLAAEAWALSGEGTLPRRIIVFCNSRDGAIKTEAAVTKLAKGDKKQGIESRDIETQLFVGARRVRERQEVADWLKAHGFIAGSEVTTELPSFVFSTSAGEVGVDLDADHMVSDLVPFERMVQRFGRVNRRGEGDAEVRVAQRPDPAPDLADDRLIDGKTFESGDPEAAQEAQPLGHGGFVAIEHRRTWSCRELRQIGRSPVFARRDRGPRRFVPVGNMAQPTAVELATRRFVPLHDKVPAADSRSPEHGGIRQPCWIEFALPSALVDPLIGHAVLPQPERVGAKLRTIGPADHYEALLDRRGVDRPRRIGVEVGCPAQRVVCGQGHSPDRSEISELVSQRPWP